MDDQRRSLLDSGRSLLDTALGLLQTRIELLATEIEEEKARLLSVLAFGMAACVLLSLGVIFFALTLTVLFWDEHRLLVLGLFSGSFLLVGALALVSALRNAKPRERLLSATVAELKQDRNALRGEDL
jgi:uncharacterized membrane protein YqjE